MSFCCPIHGYYAPVPGATIAICPSCGSQGNITGGAAGIHPKPDPPEPEHMVAWLREAAHELENAHGVLDDLGAPRINPDTGNKFTLAARIAFYDPAQSKEEG